MPLIILGVNPPLLLRRLLSPGAAGGEEKAVRMPSTHQPIERRVVPNADQLAAAAAHVPGFLQRRQRVVTQTIIRPTTTIIYVVTLGDGPAATQTGGGGGGTVVADPTATAQSVDPAVTITPVTPQSPPSAGSTNVGTEYLGAILGSVAAFCFLVFLIWYCLVRPRILASREEGTIVYYTDEGYSSSGSSSSGGGSQPPPSRPPGGGPNAAMGYAPPMRGPVLNNRQPTFPPSRDPAIPPTRDSGYTQTAETQIPGVRVFP